MTSRFRLLGWLIFRNDGVRVLVGRRAAAKEPEWFETGVPELVPVPGRGGDGDPGHHVTLLSCDAIRPVPCVML